MKNADALVVVATLGSILVPAFWALDWFVVPDHVYQTAALRLLCAVYGTFIIALKTWRTDFVVRHVDFFGTSFTGLVAGSITLMCWLHEGYASQYYVGIALVVVGAGLLFVWDLKIAAAFHGSVYAVYMLPGVLGVLPFTDLVKVINNQFFLISFIVITLSSQRHRYQLEVSQYEGQLALERTTVELEGTLDRLKELDRLKSQFFSNITHELRTPLTMILSPLESMLAGDLGRFDDSQLAYLKSIWRNAFRLLKLVNDLLDLVKLEERHGSIDIEPTDAAVLLEEIAAHSRPLAARKQIELAVDLRSRPAEIYADRDRIEQLLINLLSNALKFTPDGGKVTLSLDEDEGHVVMEVVDTGVGIPPDKLQAIFERFSQGDASTTRRFGGTGIGLALAREIAALHGGNISVESEVGRGSTFRVTLRKGSAHFPEEMLAGPQTEEVPLNDSSGPTEQEPREWARQLLERQDYRFMEIAEVTERRLVERDADAFKASRVLVVDDNLEILKFIHLQLHEDHAVYLARDGVQGLELARREVPDVIISDYMMPRMDGLQMLHELSEDPRTANIPVIMLTAKNTLADRLDARAAGADVYLGKPFSPRELSSAVKRCMERSHQHTHTVMRAHVRSFELLSSGLAHELSNPLSAIKTAWFMMSESVRAIDDATSIDPIDRERILQLRQRIEQMGGIADRAIARIGELVKLVRQYSREGYPSTAVAMSIDDAVREAIEVVWPPSNLAPARDEALEAGDAEVACVPEELKQAISQVLINAIDAAGPDGHVHIVTRNGEGHVLVEVRDDGPGIPPENLRQIFAPFFTTKDPGKGLGIGLAITQHVVTRIGGVIEVNSTPGDGAVFRIRLPTVEGSALAAAGGS